MTNGLKKTQMRVLQYFYVDGTFEFGIGLFCLILAIFFYAETHIHGWLSAIVDSSLVIVMIGGTWCINQMIKKIKEKLTWPRTGYVSYERDKGIKRNWRIIIGLIAGGGSAFLISDLMVNQAFTFALMPLLSGLLIGMVFFIFGFRTDLKRFYLLALSSAILGAVISFSRLENNTGLVGYYTTMGVILLFTGWRVLRGYLRKNPLPPKEG